MMSPTDALSTIASIKGDPEIGIEIAQFIARKALANEDWWTPLQEVARELQR